MARIPPQVTSLLNELTTQLPIILGNNLVGIYLYGSLTQRAFNPNRSDVDCIVVTQRKLSEADFKKMGAWLAQAAQQNPWVLRLQATFLIRDEVLIAGSHACLYQFGQLTRSGSDGNPIIWKNVMKSGKTLYGPAPESFVPVITPDVFLQALIREAGYLREEIIDKANSEWRDVPYYRAYAVLTLCRILYSYTHGTVVSKPRAARWAILHLASEWEEVIKQALEFDVASGSACISLAPIVHLIQLVHAELRGDTGQETIQMLMQSTFRDGIRSDSIKEKAYRKENWGRMKWEFLGKQEMQAGNTPGRGHVYATAMWRTPVPGGWLLMTLNLKSTDPQPMLIFYPDAEHIWKGTDPPEADYLLRPVIGGVVTTSEQLLRAVEDEDIETKQLKS